MRIDNVKNLEKKLLNAASVGIHNANIIKDIIFFLKNIGDSPTLTNYLLEFFISSGKITHYQNVKIVVSIIIPCYNYSKYLRDAVTSVLRQTYQSFEIIIVNDGSTDNSHEVAIKILTDFPNFHISYINQPNSGIVQPRNRGVAAARGKYILPLDADDMIAPQFIEKTLNLLESRPDLGFISTKALFFGDKNQIWPREDFNPLNLLITNQQGNTTLYRKEMWEDVGGYSESMVHGYMDWEFWIKCVKHGWIGEQVDEPLYLYRRKSDSVVMKAKKNDAHIKTQIMHLHPEVYDVSRIKPNDERLLKKNFIHPDFLRKDFSVTPKKSSRATCEHLSPGKKKILFICHNFPPRRYAGAQLYALHLAQEINSLNLAHVEVLYPVFDEQDTNVYILSDNFDGVTVHQLHKPKTGLTHDNFRNDSLRDAFAAFFMQGAYDAVHVHSLGGQLSGIPLEIAVDMDIPVVLTLHDHWLLCYFWFLTTPDQQMCTGPESVHKCAQCIITHSTSHRTKQNKDLITKFVQQRNAYLSQIFHKTDLRIAPSHFLAKTYARYGFDGIEVQPLGLQAQTHLPKTSSCAVRFGYIGRISHRKGVNILLEAYQRVVTESGTSATLHIFGAFDDPELEKSTRQQIDSMPDARYEGQYTPEDLPQIFATIDILVVPSLWENYPLVVQEAFMHTTPVIASDVGGFPEAITHNRNGLLFRVGSVDDLAATMRRVINNPTLLAELTGNILPVRSIADDAAFYAHHYGCLLAAEPTPIPSPESNAVPRGELPTVQFYVYKNVHWPMFESLFEYLKGRDDVREVVICLPNLPNLTNCGTNHHLVEQMLNLGARIVTDPRKAKADVTFIADTIAGKVHGCGCIVNVGHGTISKGYYFTKSVWTERENWVDLLCVPGEYARERLSAILKTTVAATGMPKLDPVFSGKYCKKTLCKAMKLDPCKKIVLYAPTFNLNLSSVFAFADSFHRLDSPDRIILIKLHGSTLPHLIEQYRRIAKHSKQIIFIEDNNIAPYIGGADIMISDVSSAFMEFMALNKPVILYDNPGCSVYHGYDPNNIEYAWRDLGTRISSFEELPAVLDKLMRHGDGKEEIRQKYAGQLFADRTGHACENVWQETLRVLQSSSSKPPVPVFSIVVFVEQDAHILLRSLIHDLQFYSVMPLELTLVAAKGSLPDSFLEPLMNFNEFLKVNLIDVPGDMPIGEALTVGVKASFGDFICVLRDDVALFKNFDYILYKTLSAHPGISALTGLTNQPGTEVDFGRYIANEKSEPLSGFAYRFINRFGGIEIAPIVELSSIPPLFVFRKGAINLPAGDLLPALKSFITQGKTAICLSLFYLSLDSSFRESLLKVWRIRSSLNTQDRLKIMSDVVSHLSCPDMSEVMVRDAMKLALPKSQYRQGIANSLHARYYDTKHKEWLSSILDANDPWAKSLHADCRIINALKAATKYPGRAEQGQHKSRVMFYFFKNVHIPILIPLYHALIAHGANVEIGFSFHPPAPQIRAGLLPDEARIIEQAGVPIHATPQEFKPDVTFIADSVYPWVKGCGKLVHVGHGVLSKGQYYTMTETALREEQADLVCVPGKHHQQIMRRIISKPVMATGMAKLDPLFSGKLSRQTVLKKFGLPANKKYILFAPTFNDELSAIPYLQDNISKVIPDKDCFLLIKLHGSTKKEYKDMYKKLPAKDPRVIFVDDLDISPYLALADVLVSDVSSAMMEFAALDKPVVLFNSPDWEKYANYNPDDIEFKWRDIGIETTNIEEMREAVAACLENPEFKSEKRKKYADQLFANKYDGKAAERIVKMAMGMFVDV